MLEAEISAREVSYERRRRRGWEWKEEVHFSDLGLGKLTNFC